jgi:tetratricopeptide (TPR) repeat protein
VGLAGLLISRGDTDEPAALLIDALQALRRLYGPDHPALLEALRAQGRLRLAQQRLPEAHAAVEEAQRIQQDSLGVFTLDVPANGVLQAELALRDGRAADAVAASRLVLDELERLELGDHPLTIDARAALGEALTALGRGEEAIPVLSRAITTAESWIAGDDHRTLRLRGALAGAQTSAARRSR